MRPAKKIYFTINEETLELKGPYTRLELTELINVSPTTFRMRFNVNDKFYRPNQVHTPIRGFYIIRDTELDTYKNATNFIKASKKIRKDFKETEELKSKVFGKPTTHDRKPKGSKKLLKSDVLGKIPQFKVKTLNIYTGEVKSYLNIRDFTETENYLLADALACIGKKSSPIFHGKLILSKYFTGEEKPFRVIADFKNETYYPNLPVILETNLKTNQEKVYASGNELCKHIPFDVGDLMFSLRYEGSFSFNDCLYKLINN